MTNFDQICLCGPRSEKAVTGVALAFDLLVEGVRSRAIPHQIVDATRGATVSKSGTFSISRAIDTLCVVGLVWWKLMRCKIYYATMSTSSVGFIRDYLTVGFAKLLGRRIVLHLHGGGFEEFYTSQKPWFQWLIRSNLRRTDSIVALGELLKEQFFCVGEFVKPKLVVIPNGLTLGVEEPSAESKVFSDGQRVELLYLSSLMPSKGFFDVLQAMEILKSQSSVRYHLNLCGSFVDAKTETAIAVNDEASLGAYIETYGLLDYVTYHGQIRGEEKDKQFVRANVFLLPTSYPWEGQPLSIIEALAFSIPVISCCHKGIPELVKDGETGLFVKPEAPDSIASAVIEMTADLNRYSKMSHAAREHYEANFRRDVHLKRLISVILDCPESEVS